MDTAVDSTLVSEGDPTLRYIILPLGDLSTGTCVHHIFYGSEGLTA